jgi:hypothetical protein
MTNDIQLAAALFLPVWASLIGVTSLAGFGKLGVQLA